ncbi:MAG TPA: hypothetical protein VGM88_13055 [Kofleriaceae bacterium]|jgi:hypothetical protein
MRVLVVSLLVLVVSCRGSDHSKSAPRPPKDAGASPESQADKTVRDMLVLQSALDKQQAALAQLEAQEPPADPKLITDARNKVAALTTTLGELQSRLDAMRKHGAGGSGS